MFYVCDAVGSRACCVCLWFCLLSKELGLAPCVQSVALGPADGEASPSHGVLCMATLSSGPSVHPELGAAVLEDFEGVLLTSC